MFQISLYKIILLAFFSSLNLSTAVEIYKCHTIRFFNKMCMSLTTDKLNNKIYQISKCGMNEYCEYLSSTPEAFKQGVCVPHIKLAAEGEYCERHNRCASGICDSNKCAGKKKNAICDPELHGCKKSFTCQAKKVANTYEDDIVLEYYCKEPLGENDECTRNEECGYGLVCARIEKKNGGYKVCVKKGSLLNGQISDDAMACQSGDNEFIDDDYYCVSRVRNTSSCDYRNECNVTVNLGKNGERDLTQKCVFTSLGVKICPTLEKEKNFKRYLDESEKYYKAHNLEKKIKNGKFNIETHKFNLNNKKIAILLWKYRQWYYALDADSCTQDFFFMRDGASYIYLKNFFFALILIINIF